MTNTHLPSKIRTQIVGAVLGLGAGVFLYLTMTQMSSLSLTGLIISPNTVSENAGGVVTNVQNADPSTLIRLARQAQAVANQLTAGQASSSSSVNDVLARADERGDARAAAAAAEEARANAPVYDMTNPNYVLSDTERLAIRNAGFLRSAAGTQTSSKPALIAGTKGYTVPTPQIIQRVEVPVDREVIREVPVYINTTTPVLKGPLTNSGPGLMLVLCSSALAAFVVLRRKKLAL